MQRKQDGFTLVELMVVILIIGILVAIAIPLFAQTTGTARRRTCQSNQRAIEGASQTYRAYTSDLWTQTDVFDGNNTADTVDRLAARYFLDPPKCPTSGTYYWVDQTGSVVGCTGNGEWATGHAHY